MVMFGGVGFGGHGGLGQRWLGFFFGGERIEMGY